MKLELKHLAPYLPYGLKILDNIRGRNHINDDTYLLEPKNIHRCLTFASENEKPILRPLSDLTKEIEHNGEKFVPIRKLLEANSFNLEKMETEYINSFAKSMVEIQMAYDDAQLLLRWHFDIFGLIEKDLAVNINTLSVPE